MKGDTLMGSTTHKMRWTHKVGQRPEADPCGAARILKERSDLKFYYTKIAEFHRLCKGASWPFKEILG